MFKLRPAKERGHASLGWLSSFHTFSFGDYYDPAHTHFRSLRVINEDIVQPGEGFPMHSHQDMEIVTYIVQGELEHRDSLGNGSIIRAGEVQRMSAGKGITHSEFNPSGKDPGHLLQIWILPSSKGLEPSYEQRVFRPEEKKNRFCLIASAENQDAGLKIHQDASIFASLLERNKSAIYSVLPGRHVWIQLIRGEVEVSSQKLYPGDGLAVKGEPGIPLRALEDSEFLLFDLA